MGQWFLALVDICQILSHGPGRLHIPLAPPCSDNPLHVCPQLGREANMQGFITAGRVRAEQTVLKSRGKSKVSASLCCQDYENWIYLGKNKPCPNIVLLHPRVQHQNCDILSQMGPLFKTQ
jgi:hypothetical protein